MKNKFKFLFSFLTIACLSFMLNACGGSHSHEGHEGHDHGTEKHKGHNHGNHEGHDHGSHKGHDHGSHEGHDHGSHEGHDHGSHEGHDHGSHEGHDHGNHEEHNHGAKTNKVDMTGVEYTSAYICPMHCKGSGSKKAGACPECGMEYVANAEH